MKKVLIGKREVMKPHSVSLQVAHELTHELGGEMTAGGVVPMPMACNDCNRVLDLKIYEDELTGNIFLEGPETCACGRQVVKDDLPQMNQGQIFSLFGE